MVKKYMYIYGALGFCFGMIFPIFAHVILHQHENSTPENSYTLVNTLIWLIHSAPIFLGSLAALAGRKQDQVVQLNLKISNQLNTTQAELVDIFKNSLNEIFVFDTETLKFISASKTALKNIGYSIEELKELTPIDIKPEFTVQEFRTFVQPLLSGQRDTLKFTTPHKRKNGSTYPAAIHLQLAERDNKQVFQAMVLDQTDTLKLQEELLQASKLSAIGELAAGVGHEINNPLAIVAGNVERMRTELNKLNIQNNKLDNFLAKNQIAIERIKDIVNGLRTFARPDTDHQECINVKFAISQTLDLVSEIFKKEGVEVTQEFCQDELHFTGAIGKFQQVLMNLLSNAKDATEGQVNRKISLKLIHDDSYCELQVTDNGTGISDDVCSKIFDAFYTTKGFGEGTGLGLSLSANLIRELDGTLDFETELGKGSTFTIKLPIASKVAPIHQPADIKVPSLTSAKNILVVDDEEDIREILAETFEAQGCKVAEAANGEEALEKYINQSFEVVVTDIKMPKMDGVTLTKKLRELPDSQQPIIIAITGGTTSSMSKAENKTFSEQIDGYILKPFTSKEVAEAFNKSLLENEKRKKHSAA